VTINKEGNSWKSKLWQEGKWGKFRWPQLQYIEGCNLKSFPNIRFCSGGPKGGGGGRPKLFIKPALNIRTSFLGTLQIHSQPFVKLALSLYIQNTHPFPNVDSRTGFNSLKLRWRGKLFDKFYWKLPPKHLILSS
jgi:hypothetical protein